MDLKKLAVSNPLLSSIYLQIIAPGGSVILVRLFLTQSTMKSNSNLCFSIHPNYSYPNKHTLKGITVMYNRIEVTRATWSLNQPCRCLTNKILSFGRGYHETHYRSKVAYLHIGKQHQKFFS